MRAHAFDFQIEAAAGPKGSSRPAGEAVCPLDSAASYAGSIPRLTHFIAGLIHCETNCSNHLFIARLYNLLDTSIVGFLL